MAKDYLPFPDTGPVLKDKLPFAISSGLNRQSGVDPEVAQGFPRMSPDIAGLAYRLQAALADLEAKEVRRDEVDPDLLRVLGAGFRTENTVASALSSQTLKEALYPTEYSPALSAKQVVERVKKDQLSPFLNRFSGVETEAQYEAVKADLLRELEDRRILEGSGFGTPAAMIAGIFDLPTLLPFGAVTRVGRAASAVGAAGRVAGAAALDASVSELALQAAQVARDWQESALNIGASIVFGSVLGFGVHKVLGPAKGAQVEARMNAVLDDARAGFPKAKAEAEQRLASYQESIGVPSVQRAAQGETAEVRAGTPAAKTAAPEPAKAAEETPTEPKATPPATKAEPAEVFTRDEIEVGKARRQTKKAPSGVSGWVITEIKPPSKVTDPDNWYRLSRTANLNAEVRGRIEKGASLKKADPVWSVWSGDELLYKGLKYDEAIEKAKDHVYSANPRTDDLAGDGADGTPKSVGAAGLTVKEQLAARGLDRSDRIGSFGAFELVESLGKIPGFVGHNMRNPRMELELGPTRAERNVVNRLVINPSISRQNVEGIANPMNAEAEIRLYQAEFAQAVREASDLYKANKAAYAGEGDFANQVTRALVNGDRAEDPVVEQAAKIFRKRVFDKIANDLVANGNFTKELSVRNASGYFPLVYDAEAIRANQNEFIEFHTAAYLREIKEEYRLALVDREARKSEAWDIRKAIKDKLGKSEEEIKAEHEENIRSLRESRAQAVEQFEQRIKTERAALREPLDQQLDELATKRDEQLAEVRETLKEMLQGDLTAVQKQRLRTQAKAEELKISKRHDAAVRRVEKAHAKKLQQFEKQAARERKDITIKFDKLEAEARKARDQAMQEVADVAAAARRKLAAERGYDPAVLELNTPEKQLGKAEELAHHLYNTVVGNRRFTLEHELPTSTRNYAKFRTTPAWHADLIERGWVKTNVFDIAEHYVRTAGTDAAIGKVFRKKVLKVDEDGVVVRGPDGKAELVEIGDYNLTEAIKEVRQEYEHLIQSTRGAEQKFYVDKRDRAIANIQLLRDAARGIGSANDFSQSFNKAAELVSTLNYVTKMGGTVAASLGDPINIVIANGFGRSMRYGVVPMLTNFREAYTMAGSDLRRLARLTLANAEHEFNSRIAALADLPNPYATADPGLRFLRNLSKVFSSVSGITFWNSFWKQVAYNVGQARIIEDALQGWSRITKAERAWLANLGIDADGLKAIKAAYEAQPGEKTSAGIPIARFEEWDRSTADLFRRALTAESQNNVITPSFSDRPALAHNPMGRLLWQFRSHMITNQTRLIGRNIQLARIDDEGSKRLAVYTGFFGLAMMGALIDATKHMLAVTTATGSSLDLDRSAAKRIIDEWRKTPGTALYNSLDRSGLFGPIFEASNIFEKLNLPNIRGGMSLIAGDDRGGRNEAARFTNRHWTEALGGPTVGLIGDVARTTGFASQGLGSVFGITEPPDFNRSDFKRARRIVPFQNVPVIQQIISEGERQLGTLYDWPNPK